MQRRRGAGVQLGGAGRDAWGRGVVEGYRGFHAEGGHDELHDVIAQHPQRGGELARVKRPPWPVCDAPSPTPPPPNSPCLPASRSLVLHTESEAAAAEAAVRRWCCADVDGGRAREILGSGGELLCTTRRDVSTNRQFGPLAAQSAFLRARSQLRHQGGSQNPRNNPRARAMRCEVLQVPGCPPAGPAGEPPPLANTRCPHPAPSAGRRVQACGKPQPHGKGALRLC